MAAYAALVSLAYIIEQIRNHPRPPITLDKEQVKLLTEKVTFLQEFLEGYSHVAGHSKDADPLESRIVDAAYAAEDIIESHIVDRIHAGKEINSDEETSTGEDTSSSEEIAYCKEITPGEEISTGREISSGEEISPHEKISSGEEITSGEEISPGKEISSGGEISSGEEASSSKEIKMSPIDLYQGLNKVIEDMDLIKKEVMEIKEKMGVPDQRHKFSMPAGSSRSHSAAHSTMVDFGDILNRIMDKLTQKQPRRLTMSITGMAGIGKTTLAQNIYENQFVVEHFHIHAWGTVSQDYNIKEILLAILLCLEDKGSRESLSEMNEEELGETLYKSLCGRTYLIVLDDIWNIDVWDKITVFFPENNNGSRIMLTTRLSELASKLSDFDHVFTMKFLDEDQSWNLFCKHVFGKEDCPVLGLQEVGKKIAESCKGLPLSISVIGGFLAKSEQTRQYWEHIAEKLHSIVNLEDDERCLQILYMSYNNLPVHLKSCFLYMGIFQEDYIIRISQVIKLWVAEGFINPICGKSCGKCYGKGCGNSLEEAAEEYFQELTRRNLVLVKKKFCLIHDLLRDLCLREARKQKFLCVLQGKSLNIPQGLDTERRICMHPRIMKGRYAPQVRHALKSASLVRSFTWLEDDNQPLPSSSFRLLRVLPTVRIDSLEAIIQHVNLRMVEVKIDTGEQYEIPSSICLLWNLRTLLIVSTQSRGIIMPFEFWQMTQLRYVVVAPTLFIPDPPPSGCTDDIVLENLEVISGLHNFEFSEEVVKRIPNIKRLRISYDEIEEDSPPNYYCLNNLGHLHKLEHLSCIFYIDEDMPSHLAPELTFPHSLKKLTLEGTNLKWEDLTTNVGSFPHLQELKLLDRSVTGPHWETVEGQFPSLKFLLIHDSDLEYWKTEGTHFPRLEHLLLRWLYKLEEIPLSIGEIARLQSIKLENCSDSAVDSAKRIQEEQEADGNESLRVRIWSLEEPFLRESEDEYEEGSSDACE